MMKAPTRDTYAGMAYSICDDCRPGVLDAIAREYHAGASGEPCCCVCGPRKAVGYVVVYDFTTEQLVEMGWRRWLPYEGKMDYAPIWALEGYVADHPWFS